MDWRNDINRKVILENQSSKKVVEYIPDFNKK